MAVLEIPRPPVEGIYLKKAADEIRILPGKSLLPVCKGEPVSTWREAAYCESYNTLNSVHPGQWARTIRTQKHRYTYYPDGYGEQLFDLISDPDELNNLVADPAYADVKAGLKDRLMELIILQDYPKTTRELFKFGVH